jgi:hypothetical protein
VENAITRLGHGHDLRSAVSKPLRLPRPLEPTEQDASRASEFDAVPAVAAFRQRALLAHSCAPRRSRWTVLHGFAHHLSLSRGRERSAGPDLKVIASDSTFASMLMVPSGHQVAAIMDEGSMLISLRKDAAPHL